MWPLQKGWLTNPSKGTTTHGWNNSFFRQYFYFFLSNFTWKVQLFFLASNIMMKFSELSDKELIACWTLAMLWRRSNGRHLRYFSVDMIRHHDQDNNKTWHLIWDPQFQRVRVHDHHHGALAAGRQTQSWNNSWELASQSISMNQGENSLEWPGIHSHSNHQRPTSKLWSMNSRCTISFPISCC